MEEIALRIMDAFIAWFEIPRNGLSSVFTIAFISATLLPLGSEPAVFGFIKLNPDQFWAAILVATLGNTLGGIVDYWMGYGAKRAVAAGKESKYLRWFERLGPKALFFSFLPAVGDPLCAVAGWLKLAFWPSVAWMALGKFCRYLVATVILLGIPNSFWASLLSIIKSF